MIRHNEHRLLAEAQPFGFHGGSNHLEGFARAYFVRQERIAPIKNMSNSIALMLSQNDFRIHAGKADMLAVVLPWTGAIE